MRSLFKAYIILIFLAIPVSINAQGRDYISVKVEGDTSLMELIKHGNYDIDDEKVQPFLEEFMRLNEGIKSIRIIPKGEVIKLPTRYLKKTITSRKERARPSASASKKEEKNLIVTNIMQLFDHLGEVVSMKTGRTVSFPLTEKATLSIDTERFPLLELSDHRLILLDYGKRLPDDVKDVIEINWPEYTVISSRDIIGIIRQVLGSTGYSCLNDGKVIIGDDTQIEIKPDCIIMRKSHDVMESDFIILSIIKEDEFGFPKRFLDWTKDLGINLISLSMRDTPLNRKEPELIVLPVQKEMLISGFLDYLGYEVRRNVGLLLTERKGYKLNITVDMAFKYGKRTKLVDLSGLPQSVTGILKRHGIDIMSVRNEEDNRKIMKDLLNFLYLSYIEEPEKVSSLITPAKVKYRVRTSGIVVRSKRGNLLLSDYKNTELLRSLIDSKISLIKYN